MTMRVAFPVEDHKGLDDVIFEHFGHAPAFLIVDLDEGGEISSVKVVDNPFVEGHSLALSPLSWPSRGSTYLYAGELDAVPWSSLTSWASGLSQELTARFLTS